MDKVTKASLENIKAGGRAWTFRCETAADFQSQQRMAYWVKQNCPRKDGGVYNITSSARGMTITVSVLKGE